MRLPVKKLLTIIAAILLLAAAVCTLPFPTKMDITMTGSEVNEDGTAIADRTLHLEGWKFNYLFRNDTVKLDVQIDPSGLDLAALNHTALYTEAFPQWDYASWLVYLPEMNGMRALTLYLDKDQAAAVIKVNDRQFVFSADPDADLQEYWDNCPN